jgi:hypothetical protein
MDIDILAISAICGVVLIVASRTLLSAQERLTTQRLDAELEMAKLKSGWYGQMQAAKADKKPKKTPKNAEDDEEDDLDVLVDALRPYQGFVKGLAQSKGWPVDVDRLFAGDPVEHDKVGSFIEAQLAKGPGAPALGDGNKDWWASA